MQYTKEQLKDIVANIDADYYIVKGDVESVCEMLEEAGYDKGWDSMDVDAVIAELQKDPYFKKLAEKWVA